MRSAKGKLYRKKIMESWMRAEVRKEGVNRRTLGQGPLGSSRRGKTGGSVSHNLSHRVETVVG
jgi:hypothetical protein